MWNLHYLKHLDFRMLLIIIGLMMVSLCTISSTTAQIYAQTDDQFLTPFVKSQILWFGIGMCAYLFLSGFHYHKLRKWAWAFYIVAIILLIGLFFTEKVRNAHRWYRFPLFQVMIQPSDYAKLVVVLLLSRFLEKREGRAGGWKTLLQASAIVVIPFALILKQPDLGSAFVLLFISYGLFYVGGIHPLCMRISFFISLGLLFLVFCIFLGVFPQDSFQRAAGFFLKEYQYDRLNARTYHHQAAKIAIGLGKYRGSGWRKGEFIGRKFLPAGHTDSVFPAFAEEFGVLGVLLLLLLFLGMIHYGFQVTSVARDPFGRFLSAGITLYLATHVLINVGMMCGLIPITGIPLPLISYGGSSILSTMSALGILQSVYTKRFVF